MTQNRAAGLALAVGASMLVSSVPALAAPASPQAIAVDCGIGLGVADTTITGRVGDTFTIDNTAGGSACLFGAAVGSYTAVVSATNLSSDQLGAGAVSTVTIVAAGSFTVTPQAGAGTAGTMSVVIDNPTPVQEYTITFDPNGGTCSSNPLTVTAASNDWYALPTDGSGPYQCQREDYVLTGWSHGSTVFQPGGIEQAPDLPVPAPSFVPFSSLPSRSTIQAAPTPAPSASGSSAMAADHETLYAVWQPQGVAITYDANVALADQCVDGSGNDLDVADRSTEREVYYAGTGDTLATTAPCSPLDGEGAPLILRGWALTGDGPLVYGPGTPLVHTKLTAGSHETLYALWSTPPSLSGTSFVMDENVQFTFEVDASELVLTVQIRQSENEWFGLSFGTFMFPADSLIVSFNNGDLSWFDGYNPGIPTLGFFPAPAPDDTPVFIQPGANPQDNRENWDAEDISVPGSGVSTVRLQRPLQTGDIFDRQLALNQIVPFCAAYNLAQGFLTAVPDAQQPNHTAYRCWELYVSG